MPTVEEAVHERLSSHAGVSGKVGGRIYPHKLPQGVTLPALAYSVISAPRESVMGRDTDAHPRVEVTAWDETQTGAQETAVEVLAALQRFSGTVTVGGNDFEFKGTFVETELDRFDDDTERAGRQVDFRITHGE